jgi:Tfp pilus assembly protein FimT
MAPSGVTLPELVLCLLLLGLAVQALLTPFRHQADVLTVRAAREEVVALLQRARAEARSAGRSSVVIEEGADPYLVRAGGRPHDRVTLVSRGVRIEVLGARSSVTLRYGTMGVARFGSASLKLVKRDAEADLVISSYGRVTR